VTNEGEVDLAKVQDIIRALRRRYSARSNVQHIFKDWDVSGRGYLLPEDLRSMLDKMGLSINKDEANMMLIALDENGD
jgi:Ca2+-binding EF-hand superfamily protein